jgi:hypothetical protein
MQDWVLHLISILVSLSVISLPFAMMFKWLPDAEVNIGITSGSAPSSPPYFSKSGRPR